MDSLPCTRLLIEKDGHATTALEFARMLANGTTSGWNFAPPRAAGGGSTSFGGGLVSVVGAACEPDLIADMEAFFAAKKVAGAERTLEQGLERARSCVDLRQRQQDVLHEWLARRQ
jgi:hypothetical protein